MDKQNMADQNIHVIYKEFIEEYVAPLHYSVNPGQISWIFNDR